MREFRLIDNDGREYPLTDAQVVFMHGTSGLGYSYDAEFQRVGTAHKRLTSKLAQGVITATVSFNGSNVYDDWFEFTQFCQNEPLRLGYKPQNVEYFCDCYVTKNERSESGGFGLESKITIHTISPWYKTVRAFSNSQTAKEGKIYDYKFDYRYTNSILQSVTIDSNSYISSPVKLIIFGRALNPSWRHYVNNRVVTEGRVFGTIEEGRKLIVDTTTGDYTIMQYDLYDNMISDMYQLSDFSTYRFVSLERGKNMISVSHEGSGVIDMIVEAKIEYPTV